MDFTVDEFVAFCVNLLFWYVVIQIALGFLAGYLGNKIEERDDHVQNLIEEVAKLIHIVEIEKHGDIEYWFDSHDDTFLAQGKTMPELIEHCRSRFPDHSFFLVQSENIVCKISGPDWDPVDVNFPLPKV